MQEALRHTVSDKVFMAKAAKKVGSEESLFLVGSRVGIPTSAFG